MSKANRLKARHILERAEGRKKVLKAHECEIDPNRHYFWKCDVCGFWWQVDDSGAWHRMNRADRRRLAHGRRRKGSVHATA